jgi:hypothetical protein
MPIEVASIAKHFIVASWRSVLLSTESWSEPPAYFLTFTLSTARRAGGELARVVIRFPELMKA